MYHPRRVVWPIRGVLKCVAAGVLFFVVVFSGGVYVWGSRKIVRESHASVREPQRISRFLAIFLFLCSLSARGLVHLSRDAMVASFSASSGDNEPVTQEEGLHGTTSEDDVFTKSLVETKGSRLHLCEFVDQNCPTDEDCNHYRVTHPLVFAMLKGQDTRTQRMQMEGAKQMSHPVSNDTWFPTLFVWEGRAIGFVLPSFCVVVIHAVVYTCIHELGRPDAYDYPNELSSWEIFFGVALNATLSLLLVFRLNRAAARWWLAREFWGVIIAQARTLTSGIVLHGKHNPVDRDDAVRWIAAYAVCVMEFLRGCSEIHSDLFAGILTPAEKTVLQRQSHPPLYAAHRIHSNLLQLFDISEDTPMSLAVARSSQLATLESSWSILLDKCGGLERIKATPLPVVYVSHLRTFLLLALLLYPYVWGAQWRWSTIPIVALAAFGMLGIEAASVECEQPFRKDRVNSLNMNGYCLGLHANILQILKQDADRELAHADKFHMI